MQQIDRKSSRGSGIMPRDRSYGSQLKNNNDLAAVVQCRGGLNGSAMQL